MLVEVKTFKNLLSLTEMWGIFYLVMLLFPGVTQDYGISFARF
jgi:hypothetical protein